MPFGDSIRVLGFASIFFGSAGIVIFSICRLIRYRKLSRGWLIMAFAAMLPLADIIVRGVIEGNIELNPHIESKERLIGIYSEGRQSLTLNADGTFTSNGFMEITSGLWSNDDWNLRLSNSLLAQPRIITRNGLLCIAPFYAGVDRPVGLLLKKEIAGSAPP